jgi:thymidylate synthase (FAD)
LKSIPFSTLSNHIEEGNMQVKLISLTQPEIDIDGQKPTPEGLIAYCARVSSPNQENPDYERLLRFCMREGHWSVFEMVDMTVEITTTLAIAPQILRHKSFCFQQFSRRYSSDALAFETYPARRQDVKNRQNSLDDFDETVKWWFKNAQTQIWLHAERLYEEALAFGIAKECARNLLPQITTTKLYMKGNVRSWIHYFQVRCDVATQKEHRDIACAIRDEIFAQKFPLIHKVLKDV